MRKLYTVLFLILTGFTFPGKKTKVWMIGDSTMSVKETKYYPETGWGMPFVNFFDSTIEVDNRAKNGRSTRTFMEEGLWKPVLENIQPGDFVLIQFGHNDEVNTKKSYTTESQFITNLTTYVQQTREKKGKPILFTPVARRKFDSTGKIQGTHDAYSNLVRVVAAKYGVPLIDLDRLSQELYQKMGFESSRLLFNYLQPGEHPNYPDGKADDTHFSELGARKIASLVAAEMKKQKMELATHFIKPTLKS